MTDNTPAPPPSPWRCSDCDYATDHPADYASHVSVEHPDWKPDPEIPIVPAPVGEMPPSPGDGRQPAPRNKIAACDGCPRCWNDPARCLCDCHKPQPSPVGLREAADRLIGTGEPTRWREDYEGAWCWYCYGVMPGPHDDDCEWAALRAALAAADAES